MVKRLRSDNRYARAIRASHRPRSLARPKSGGKYEVADTVAPLDDDVMQPDPAQPSERQLTLNDRAAQRAERMLGDDPRFAPNPSAPTRNGYGRYSTPSRPSWPKRSGPISSGGAPCSRRNSQPSPAAMSTKSSSAAQLRS